MPDTVKPVAQYLTVGGATVDITSHRFQTNYTGQGRPFADRNNPRTVDGFTWTCTGCGATSANSSTHYIRFDYGRYLDTEHRLARDDANAHAATCRAIPNPTA